MDVLSVTGPGLSRLSRFIKGARLLKIIRPRASGLSRDTGERVGVVSVR